MAALMAPSRSGRRDGSRAGSDDTGLARRAGLSRSVFADRFHARLGMPAMAYLARWRLRLAARWLRETRLSVTEILHRIGYASPAAFHRAFKREHGIAPTTYRQRELPSSTDRPG
ncbi:MAG TPA: helix-turn-helix transcriptional regulator [Kofleriaceae bacterium]|nr:helix-turn-helix transcriptional regulator [Kofleriaceae bacterium]